MVIDASVALAWLFDQPQAAAADRLLRAGPLSLCVPAVWPAEVANTLVHRQQRGLVTAAQAASWWTMLQDMSVEIDVDAASWEGAGRCWQLAHAYRLTVYDAQYLELALRLKLPLATLDPELAKAARAAGVRLAIDTRP